MPTRKTIYRVHKGQTEAVEMESVDATEACKNHPNEWSFTNPDAKKPSMDEGDPAVTENPDKSPAGSGKGKPKS